MAEHPTEQEHGLRGAESEGNEEIRSGEFGALTFFGGTGIEGAQEWVAILQPGVARIVGDADIAFGQRQRAPGPYTFPWPMGF